MAQFYEVLSQGEQPKETGQFFAAKLDDRPTTVQYVISPEDPQQQFQQQIVVVEGRQVILNNIPTEYTTQPQYIIEGDGKFLTQEQPQQQIVYMEGIDPQHQTQQIVLNHQIGQPPLSKVVGNTSTGIQIQIASPVMQVPRVNQIPQVIRPANQIRPVQVQKANMPRPVQASQLQQAEFNQNTPKEELKLEETDDAQSSNQEVVALPDGTIVSMAAYKRILAQNQMLKKGLLNRGARVVRGPTRPINKVKNGGSVPEPRIPNAAAPRYQLNQHNSFKGHIQQQAQVAQQQQARSQSEYLIQPPHNNPRRNQPQTSAPPYVPSKRIQQIIDNTPVMEDPADSIRMLVLLANGEQRLITFTLPKEACTIQEILELVQVPFQADTPIQVNETNANGINYIVTVGNVPNLNDEDSNEEFPSQTEQQTDSQDSEALPKQPSPEPPKETPKYIPGRLAVCQPCGYLSEDFNRCIRCKRKFPDNVKSVLASSLANAKRTEQRKVVLKPNIMVKGGSPAKRKAKPKISENESVVISSDEEGEDERKAHRMNQELLQKLGANVTISPVTKEPTFADIKKHVSNKEQEVQDSEEEKLFGTSIDCRTVRIGSYRCIPIEPPFVDSKTVLIHVPHPDTEESISIKIDICDIVKVLISFHRDLPVLFYYVSTSVADQIRNLLSMTPESKCFFDPLSERDESHRRITFLPKDLSEEDKANLFEIYANSGINLLEELTSKEANEILIKTCPKELTKNVVPINMQPNDGKLLIYYPPEGKGKLPITIGDYSCLMTDQFLNDVIIDFYLNYIVLNLPTEQREKVHVFSTFFYKRLTTKPQKASRKSQPSELDTSLTAAQKRHARVKNWTKTVNLFEKDFIIIPINENAHWFLAIICFPGMDGPHTFDGEPFNLEPKSPRKSSKKSKEILAKTIGDDGKSKLIPIKIEKEKIPEDPDASDKDEAEGDDSELDSDDSEGSSTVFPASSDLSTNSKKIVKRPPIKQPCILIFDSLVAGVSRCRVVATLRDYLTCEYKIKMNEEKIFNKDVIKGSCVKVPQQTNFTDCGLYLLQYAEQFFKDPIQDYYIPIGQLKNWFEEITVTKKREDISQLIKSLMKESGKDPRILPDIAFPTLNGKLVDRNDEFEDEDEEDMVEDESAEPTDKTDEVVSTESDVKTTEVDSPIKPTVESAATTSNIVPQKILNIELFKPDISEFPKQTNKETLNMLKSKRIVRHNKNTEEPLQKRQKND